MSSPVTVTEFAREYIEAWSTTERASRLELVAKLYAENATFYASEPGDVPVECHGVLEIGDNISQVNLRLVQGMGLITESTGVAANHDALRVSWQMLTPEGNVAMTGMNVLLRDEKGKIIQDYIFIG